MSNRRCGVGAPWCARADEMFNAPGLHVIDVHHDAGGGLVVTVETDEVVTGCRACGVVAVGHGRRVHRAHDAPAFGAPVVVAWPGLTRATLVTPRRVAVWRGSVPRRR